jgi:hypothetical protein
MTFKFFPGAKPSPFSKPFARGGCAQCRFSSHFCQQIITLCE